MTSQWYGTRIFLENVVVEIAIGLNDWEKYPGKTWPVRVDVEMFIDRTNWNGAERKEIVNYDRVRQYLQTWTMRPHVELLETLAEDLLQFCFQDKRVSSARVRIAKPNLYANGVVAGVEVWRDRTICSNESSITDAKKD